MQTATRSPRRPGASLLLAAAALISLTFAGGARAGEAYYLVIFGAQRTSNNPDYSHTFAAFVRTSWPGCEPCPAAVSLEYHTISWLPANMRVRTRALLSECGHNFDLHTTLRYALGNDERVSMWGPYRIEPELYGRALRQIALLESGRVRYKATDVGNPSDRVSNCIHAASSLSEGYRLRVASPGWGETASYLVLRELEPWVIDRDRVHAWVGSAVGLDCYPIIYRSWENPRSGAFRGPVNRLLGGERDLRPTYGPPNR